VVGLILFSGESYESWRMNRVAAPNRYFWWSSIRLDSNPLDKHFFVITTCKNSEENCFEFNRPFMTVEAGWLAKSLMYSAIPAFLAGAVVVGGLSLLGVSQVLSFMVSMPVLIFAWYYFAGRLIDRWKFKRSLRMSS